MILLQPVIAFLHSPFQMFPGKGFRIITPIVGSCCQVDGNRIGPFQADAVAALRAAAALVPDMHPAHNPYPCATAYMLAQGDACSVIRYRRLVTRTAHADPESKPSFSG